MSTTHKSLRGSGHVVLITGAGGAIGEAIARDLDALGYELVLVDIDERRLAAVAASSPYGLGSWFATRRIRRP